MEDRKFLVVVIGSAIVVLGAVIGGTLLLRTPPQVGRNAPAMQPVAPAPALKPAPKSVALHPVETIPKPAAAPKPQPARKKTLGVSKETLIKTVSALHLYDGETVRLPAKLVNDTVSWNRPLHSVLITSGDPEDVTSAIFTFLQCDDECGDFQTRSHQR